MRSEVKNPEIAYRRRWLTLAVLCMSLMVIGLDNTILNVALPTLPSTAAPRVRESVLKWLAEAESTAPGRFASWPFGCRPFCWPLCCWPFCCWPF